jgi:hypothetical protein
VANSTAGKQTKDVHHYASTTVTDRPQELRPNTMLQHNPPIDAAAAAAA